MGPLAESWGAPRPDAKKAYTLYSSLHFIATIHEQLTIFSPPIAGALSATERTRFSSLSRRRLPPGFSNRKILTNFSTNVAARRRTRPRAAQSSFPPGASETNGLRILYLRSSRSRGPLTAAAPSALPRPMGNMSTCESLTPTARANTRLNPGLDRRRSNRMLCRSYARVPGRNRP